MGKLMRNSIEYSGLADDIPSLPDPCCIKQSVVSGSLKLPDSKPEISRILKVSVDASIKNARIISTPESVSVDGQIMTGRKMIVEGELAQWVEYAGETHQAVYAAGFNTPFVSYIVLPGHYKTGRPAVSTPYIEDASISLADGKTLYYSAVILIVLEY